MAQKEQVRGELTGRIAARLSLPPAFVEELLGRDSTLEEIWGDYLLCRETIERFRAARSMGEARVVEFEQHAASLEDEIARRVEELRS